MSEQFKRMKESRVFTRGEFEDLKAEAMKQGISFRKFAAKTVMISDNKLTVEVLYTTDANPMNSANTNIYVISEKPMVDYGEKLEEAKEQLKLLEESVAVEMKNIRKIARLEKENTKLEQEIRELEWKKQVETAKEKQKLKRKTRKNRKRKSAYGEEKEKTYV